MQLSKTLSVITIVHCNQELSFLRDLYVPGSIAVIPLNPYNHPHERTAWVPFHGWGYGGSECLNKSRSWPLVKELRVPPQSVFFSLSRDQCNSTHLFLTPVGPIWDQCSEGVQGDKPAKTEIYEITVNVLQRNRSNRRQRYIHIHISIPTYTYTHIHTTYLCVCMCVYA